MIIKKPVQNSLTSIKLVTKKISLLSNLYLPSVLIFIKKYVKLTL